MKVTPLVMTIGLVCAAPLAQATHDNNLSGWIGQVCYSNGSGATIIDYQSYNGCAVRLSEAVANPPFGTSVTQVTSCSLRSNTSVALPWCGVRDLLSVEIDNGDVRPALDFQQKLEDLRKRHAIDEYERKLRDLQDRR
jgi:hypothetical protein